MESSKEIDSHPSIFIMLNDHLVKLFQLYITDGRIRAPPEFKLRDLIPTFNEGSKTDRRALQCKFKSWSRRMVVENGDLKLAGSKKLIIPLQKCDELIMKIHSDEHLSINDVISQIQKNYTWTRKNFGMDREMVEKTIIKNCNNEDCKNDIENNRQPIRKRRSLKRLHQKRFSHMRQQYIMSTNPTMHTSHQFYRWPMSSYAVSILKKRMHYAQHTTARRFLSTVSANRFNKKHNVLPRYKVRQGVPGSNKDVIRIVRTCKKPKNIHELKQLLETAEDRPADFPAYITSPKTKFLGGLGLVPKRICSKKTLSRLRKEMKHKENVEDRYARYMNQRKFLRDRNKINKKHFHRGEKKRAYLTPSTSQWSRYLRPVLSNSLVKSHLDGFDSHKGEAKPSARKSLFPRKVPRMATELIDLVTSSDDDAINSHQSFRVDAKKNTNFSGAVDLPKTGTDNKRMNSLPHSSQSSIHQEFKINPKIGLRHIFTRNSGVLQNEKVSSTSSSLPQQFQFVRPVLIPLTNSVGAALLQSAKLPVISTRSHNLSQYSGQAHSKVRSFIPIIPKPSGDVPETDKNRTQNKLPNAPKLLMIDRIPKPAILVVPSNFQRFGQDSRNGIGRLTALKMVTPLNFIRTTSNNERTEDMKGNKGNTACKPAFTTEKNSSKTDIDAEMLNLTNWINDMKSNFIPPSPAVYETPRKLVSQLAIGISLVRDVRNALFQVEKNETFKENENQLEDLELMDRPLQIDI